ncbi:MAG TPA: ABC transporter ATP-binding protein, partial [Rhodocyclaceae bacterium]|nr:ABC transporter ATP-binding protein [Rhodocyclaceae bacterium]
TEGLAPRVSEQLWSALKCARGSGLAMVVVDKDFDALSACADRFVIMEKGRIAWCGRSDLLNENRGVFEQFVGVA